MREIPFDPAFRDLVRSGAKTMTARNSKYGEPGDVLAGPDCILELLYVERVTLGFIAWNLYDREGCASPAAFEEAWARLHPRAGYDPKRKVWLHVFRVFRVEAD